MNCYWPGHNGSSGTISLFGRPILISGAIRSVRLPNKPHGLNAYSHLHDMVFVSALNPKPDHIAFLKSRGLSTEQIKACIYFATCYQSVMRISTRDPLDTNSK